MFPRGQMSEYTCVFLLPPPPPGPVYPLSIFCCVFSRWYEFLGYLRINRNGCLAPVEGTFCWPRTVRNP